MKHDALFKSLLKTGRLLSDFFSVFLPDLHSAIDFSKIEFIDKERFTAEGKPRIGDLLIKTKFRGEDAAFLIHLEHEAQRRSDLAFRMLEYFLLDWREFGLPVYPVAVLSHRDLNPQSRSPLRLTFRQEELLNFRFAIVDLGRLDARKHVRMSNTAAMALSTRMKVDTNEKAQLALDFMLNRQLAECTTVEMETISSFFFAYQIFEEEDALKLQKELSMIDDMDIPKAVLERNPIFEFGRNKGLLQGEANLVLRQLARHIGSISPEQEQSIRKLSLDQVEALGEALLDFRSAEDLSRWLGSHR